MSPVLGLRVLTDEPAPSLCRTATAGCVACCHGSGMREDLLARALGRQSDVFSRRFARRAGLPDRLELIVFELLVRRGMPLLLAPLFLLPGLGPLLRAWLGKRMCCVFLGYPNGDRNRPGCLLHPTRWAGRDVRRAVAFYLLPGMGCGEPGFNCRSAQLYQSAGIAARRRFRVGVRGLGWFAYGRAVGRLETELLAGPGSAVPPRRPDSDREKVPVGSITSPPGTG